MLLEVRDLQKFYPIRKGLLLRHVGDVRAVDRVSFSLARGKTLGIVGESGCGKSTLGKAIIRLHEPTSGKVFFDGRDFLSLRAGQLRKVRRNLQMIFQDPFASLDPRMSVGQILLEPLRIHQVGTPRQREKKVRELVEIVGLDQSCLNRYPHEFSGGQRQRISIARCLALEPKLIVADEPVSALDVSVQAQILNLIKEVQRKFSLAIIFISHDLSVVEHMCDDIAIMYLGKIVELAPRDEILSRPAHPYTQALIASVSIPGRGKKLGRKTLGGEVPSPLDPPAGCAFHPRCQLCLERCKTEEPRLQEGVACWVAQEERC